MVDVDRKALIAFNSTSVARNSLLKLSKQTSLSLVRAQFIFIDVWNYLSEETRSSTSVCFKKVCLHTT